MNRPISNHNPDEGWLVLMNRSGTNLTRTTTPDEIIVHPYTHKQCAYANTTRVLIVID